jgi:hypothetical protein
LAASLGAMCPRRASQNLADLTFEFNPLFDFTLANVSISFPDIEKTWKFKSFLFHVFGFSIEIDGFLCILYG